MNSEVTPHSELKNQGARPWAIWAGLSSAICGLLSCVFLILVVTIHKKYFPEHRDGIGDLFEVILGAPLILGVVILSPIAILLGLSALPFRQSRKSLTLSLTGFFTAAVPIVVYYYSPFGPRQANELARRENVARQAGEDREAALNQKFLQEYDPIVNPKESVSLAIEGATRCYALPGHSTPPAYYGGSCQNIVVQTGRIELQPAKLPWFELYFTMDDTYKINDGQAKTLRVLSSSKLSVYCQGELHREGPNHWLSGERITALIEQEFPDGQRRKLPVSLSLVRWSLQQNLEGGPRRHLLINFDLEAVENRPKISYMLEFPVARP